MPLKIEIFDKPEPEKTPVLMLNVHVREDGVFEVFACDARGAPLPSGILWKLLLSGRQVCCSGVSSKLGLDLDGSRIRDA